MATFKGVNRTKLDAPNSGNIVTQGHLRGNLSVMFDSYEFSSTAAGSIIQLGDLLPVGAAIFNIIVKTDALGGSTTIAIGDASDDDRYLVAYATTSAATKTLQADGPIDNNGYQIGTATSDQQIQATLAGGTGTGTLYIWIVYSV